MSVAALVLAAGRGERLGGVLPKAFVPLLERTLLERSIEALGSAPEVDLVVPVIAAADRARYEALELGRLHRLGAPVDGGAERQDSMRNGLSALPDAVSLVAVHDAARCLVDPRDVSRVIAAARECGAALLARPLSDTLKRVRAGRVIETPERRECWLAQTPQVFRRDLLEEGLAKAEAEGRRYTDDSQLVEGLGVEVRVVQSAAGNIKITAPEDLAAAEAWLRGGESGR